jgi:uncharacterized protein (DUF1697 family)
MAKVRVALLRGINVGGKAKVEMARLRSVCEAAGAADVATYINSGNVIFTDSRRPAAIARALEEGIEAEFGFPVKVLLRDLPQMRALVDAIPAEWTNDSEHKTDVLFLSPEDDEPGVVDRVDRNPDIEDVLHAPGAIVWHILRKHQGRGRMAKIVGSDFYRRVTIRNVNTVRKLLALMEAR